MNISNITTYQAGVAQAATHRSLQKLCDDILKPFGISKMQWLIIGTVLDTGKKGIRVTHLAEKLGTTLPYLTTAINLLESKAILVRKDNNSDNRSKLVSINKAFVPLCVEIEATLRQALRDSIYAEIDPAEFRTYMKVLYQLSDVGSRH